jgi:hypothetical protein
LLAEVFKNICMPFFLRILQFMLLDKCFGVLVIYAQRNSNRNFSW